MTRELTVRIIVEQPPPDIDFALQKGKGNTSKQFKNSARTGRTCCLNSVHR